MFLSKRIAPPFPLISIHSTFTALTTAPVPCRVLQRSTAEPNSSNEVFAQRCIVQMPVKPTIKRGGNDGAKPTGNSRDLVCSKIEYPANSITFIFLWNLLELISNPWISITSWTPLAPSLSLYSYFYYNRIFPFPYRSASSRCGNQHDISMASWMFAISSQNPFIYPDSDTLSNHTHPHE